MISADRPHILILESDPKLRLLADLLLEAEGFAVTPIATARDLAAARRRGGIDLVVLGTEPFDAALLNEARALRRSGEAGLFIMADVDAPESRLIALRLGADDCVSPGFDSREVIGRIHAVHRRVTEMRALASAIRAAAAEPAAQAAWQWAPATRRLRFGDGSTVTLTTTEASLMSALVEAGGQAASRLDLSRAVYGCDDDPEGRRVAMVITRLRRKIEPDSNRPVHLIADRAAGYRLTVVVQTLANRNPV